MAALKDIDFPKSKSGVIPYIEKSSNINEASLISLNELEDRIYHTIDKVCENIKIECNQEIRAMLIEMKFPATKNDIIDYARFRNFSDFVIISLEKLPDSYTFKNISEVCK